MRAEMLMKKANASQKESIASALKRLTDEDEMGSLFKVLMIA